MKKSFYQIMFIIFCLFANTAISQKTDSVLVRKNVDSVQLAKVDSVYRIHQSETRIEPKCGLIFLAVIPRIGYTNFKGHFLHLGFKIPLDDDFRWYSGILANFGYIDKTFIALPEAQLYRRLFQFNGKLQGNTILIGATISPYYYSPRIVYSNILTAEFGYNIEFNKPKHHSTEGFYFKIGLDLFL